MHESRSSQTVPAFAPRRFPVPEASVYFNLEVSAARYSRRTALSYYGGRISYARLLNLSQAVAGWLQHRAGVQRGDRVMLFMQNSVHFVIAYYAILACDAVVVPVNPMNQAGELEHYIRDAGVSVCLCGSELAERLEPLLGHTGLRRVVVGHYADYADLGSDVAQPDFLRSAAPPVRNPSFIDWREVLSTGLFPNPPRAGAGDMAAIPYTSGTTGQPKGCVHTHASLMATICLAGVWAPSSSADVCLAVVPFFHVTGMQLVMNSTLYVGGELVIMTRWDRELALQLIERHRVTNWTNIPTMVVDLFASPNLTAASLRSLRHIGGGGAAMPEAVAARLHQLTGLDYVEGYGLTETAAPTHSQPWGRPKRQCLGVPVSNTESVVVNPDALKPLPAGAVGEIVSSGPQVFQGYWKAPEATREAFVEIDGKRWFRTGDLGIVDDEGYFFIVDRLKRVINASGYKVWPAEVEAMMYAHPAVREACVVAAQDPYRGETVKAIVVLHSDHRAQVTQADIAEWCKSRMAAYKVPRIVEFVDSLPKSASGEIMWRTLQEAEKMARPPAG